jgi:hypothetical protein
MKLVFLFAVAIASVASACGRDAGDIDESIGASCASDRDCDTRCYIDNDFPQGFCSQPCASDQDCPGDAFCIDTNGGVCMFACPEFDCSRLGAGWTCRNRDRPSGGEIRVCSGD